ncbi:MAG: ACT domain-containing protein, partial [Nitrososphaerales archaeon]
MSRNTLTIPTVVAAIITRDLALYECFKRRLVNYHAVAGSIKPEVEKLAGKSTTINTIVVAITRFSETIER